MSWIKAILTSVNVGIVNGTVAKPHSRPYMVSVQGNGEHVCGGFLVSDLFVMTAAHCWKESGLDKAEVTAVIGAHDLKSNDFERIAVKEHHIHPEFHYPAPSNDIMLLKLGKSTENIKNATNISISKLSKGMDGSCSIAGWGRIKTKGNTSNVLLETNVDVYKNCKTFWNYNNILCAGGKKGGLCEGGIGGPLVCNDTAVGIASFTEKDKCDKPKKPNVHTNISAFMPWIKLIIDDTDKDSNRSVIDKGWENQSSVNAESHFCTFGFID
ncbi:mast cell protease 4-like isoform X2 [Hoplias malabaricus]|uniref:mast cell protease 4-like isoform X2 n=1 Tax=Hoplias malabaricus TaxID=27720 RepID=UPI0034628012